MSIKTEILQLLENTDFRNFDQSNKYVDRISELLQKITLFTQTIEQNKIHFTRGRINENPNNLFENLSELWYPNSNFVRLGRCNYESQPVFYCSNFPATAIFEIAPKLNDVFTLLEVKITKPKIELINLGGNTQLIKDFNTIGDQDQEFNKLMEILFREKIEPNSTQNYHKTAFISKSLLDQLDGLAYPSVGSNCKGWNIAFTPDFIDKNGCFIKANRYKVVEWTSENNYRIECLNKATNLNSDNDFVWQSINKCETHNFNESVYEHN